jgi:hypothetical protein
MTKQQEIDILAAAADKLGADSYCGPWLRDQIPAVEQDMRSDFLPTPSWAESRRIHENSIANAKAEAERIIRQAKEEAESIKREAEKMATNTRRRLAIDLRKALEALE